MASYGYTIEDVQRWAASACPSAIVRRREAAMVRLAQLLSERLFDE